MDEANIRKHLRNKPGEKATEASEENGSVRDHLLSSAFASANKGSIPEKSGDNNAPNKVNSVQDAWQTIVSKVTTATEDAALKGIASEKLQSTNFVLLQTTGNDAPAASDLQPSDRGAGRRHLMDYLKTHDSTQDNPPQNSTPIRANEAVPKASDSQQNAPAADSKPSQKTPDVGSLMEALKNNDPSATGICNAADAKASLLLPGKPPDSAPQPVIPADGMPKVNSQERPQATSSPRTASGAAPDQNTKPVDPRSIDTAPKTLDFGTTGRPGVDNATKLTTGESYARVSDSRPGDPIRGTNDQVRTADSGFTPDSSRSGLAPKEQGHDNSITAGKFNNSDFGARSFDNNVRDIADHSRGSITAENSRPSQEFVTRTSFTDTQVQRFDSLQRSISEQIREPERRAGLLEQTNFIATVFAGIATLQERQTPISARMDFSPLSFSRATIIDGEIQNAFRVSATIPLLSTRIESAERVSDRSNLATMIALSPDRNAAVSLISPADRADRSSLINSSIVVGERNSSISLLPSERGISGLQQDGKSISTNQDRGAAELASKVSIIRTDDSAIAAAKVSSNTVSVTGDRGSLGLAGELSATQGQKTASEAQIAGAKHTADAAIAGKPGDKIADPNAAELSGKVNGIKISSSGQISDSITAAITVRQVAASIDAATAAQKGDLTIVDGEFEVDEKGKPTRRIKDSDKRYLTGVELTLGAILMISGAAKLREERSEEAERVLRDKNVNEEEQNTQKILHRRTHLVLHGQTLQSIAEDIFQNAAVAWLIADMNASNIKEEWIDGKRVIELRSRQVLELPEPEEINDFMARLRKDFKIDQLVTVVAESTIDRELVNNFLGSVSGAAPNTQISLSTETIQLQPTLPALSIHMGDPEDLPVTSGIASLVKDISLRVGRLVKRPTGKLGTVSS